MNQLSTFLFARPSFYEGVGRVIDFGNTLSMYNISETGEEADYSAFLADWSVIGDDIQGAICAPRRLERR